MVSAFRCSPLIFRPTGKISVLQLPDTANSFYFVRYPKGHPEQAHFVSTALSKQEVFHNFFHYYVTKPSQAKKCSSCKHHLNSQLCIQTQNLCIFAMSYRLLTRTGNSVLVKVAFC